MKFDVVKTHLLQFQPVFENKIYALTYLTYCIALTYL